MADQIVPPAAAPDSAMHHLLPHFQGIRSVVENQHHRTPKDQQQRDDCGTAASIGANHGGLGSREEFFKALEQAYSDATAERRHSSFSYTCCPYALFLCASL